jgi:hypothetical protein
MNLAVANEDRIPHDRAVWREYEAQLVRYDGAPAPGTGGRQVSIDYGDGQIVQGWGQMIRWQGAKRWRFGWSPAS